ncbi:terminase small subunit [Staphylococcus pseudoxylosus]|uniref:terminase small subunit n=1 Tax=Staphylococcus pseudoxylosus TaxID=2282419 RepID=UPI00384CA221
MKLTVKQQKFADEYIISGNATEAAINAGYSKKTARSVGAENLTKPYIMEYINKRLNELKEERLMSIEEALTLSASIARGEEQNARSKIYNHLTDKVDKEVTYTITPRIEERQRSIEHILKVHGILNGRLANVKLEKEIQILQKKIEQMDKAEGNNQESEIAKALIKLAGASDD